MRWLLRLCLYTVLTPLVVGGLLAAIVLERRPLVAPAGGPTTSDVRTARHLLKRFRAVTQIANDSGIRLSDRMMSAPVAGWPAHLAMVPDEDNFSPPPGDIPAAMSMNEFEATCRGLHRTEYAALLERIEARIDRLPLRLPHLRCARATPRNRITGQTA